jgi:hypothetical protein
MSELCKDPIYWMFNQLTLAEVCVLRRVIADHQGFDRNRFEVASLIAVHCIKANLVARSLAITAKGRDALAFYPLQSQ